MSHSLPNRALKILQRNLNRSTFIVWEMKRNVSVVCLIVATRSSGPPASGKIIKEMPGSVASGTLYISILPCNIFVNFPWFIIQTVIIFLNFINVKNRDCIFYEVRNYFFYKLFIRNSDLKVLMNTVLPVAVVFVPVVKKQLLKLGVWYPHSSI